MPGSPRLFSLCRGLSARHSLKLVTLNSSEERYQAFHADPMAAGVFEDIVMLPSAPPSERFGQQLHRLRRQPFFITRYRTPRFHAEQCRRIRDIYLDGGFDAIFADGVAEAQYVEDADLHCPAVIDLHDCITLFVNRMRENEPRWWRRMQLYAESRSIARCEAALSRTFGAVITNSPVDEQFMKLLDPTANTMTIGNGVDSDFFGASEVKTDMSKVVFTGVMSYKPNEDAALYFGTSILPLIRQRYPEMQFWVVGKDPGPEVRALADRPGIHVTGGVPDVRPYVHTAGVFVSPLRYGTGIKNKLLAALAMEKAVVATRHTTEGLDVRDGEHLLVADEPAAFAAKVIQLLEDPAYARRLAKSGQAFVRARYSWETSARMLEDTLRTVVQQHRDRSTTRTPASVPKASTLS
jgi:glycosyltransferase involved in cell wall biosynthesis